MGSGCGVSTRAEGENLHGLKVSRTSINVRNQEEHYARRRREKEPRENDPAPSPTPDDRLVETKHSDPHRRSGNPLHCHDRHDRAKEESEKTGDKEGESEGEKPRASIFFTCTPRMACTDLAKRPLTFSFNGGPGSVIRLAPHGRAWPAPVSLTDDGGLPPPPTA